MRKLDNLKEIFHSYEAFLIDLWGVMHNGIELYPGAMKAIENLHKENKRIVFLSNAPRPSSTVIKYLKKLNMDDKYLDNVFTSGEAALRAIKLEKHGKKFYHLGPEKDQSLFMGLERNKTSLMDCDYILCTGLFDKTMNNLEYYSNLLSKFTSKIFICTNPDLTVHKGETEEYCAGTVASIFQKLGGKVIYYGKPYEEVYKMCLINNQKTLIIGDNLRTDIKGANNLKLDSIFISNGVHREEFKNENELKNLLNKYNVEVNFYQSNLKW